MLKRLEKEDESRLRQRIKGPSQPTRIPFFNNDFNVIVKKKYPCRGPHWSLPEKNQEQAWLYNLQDRVSGSVREVELAPTYTIKVESPRSK